MKINKHNYEEILIDYLDGTLSAAERSDVELFLQENPEIAEQFSDFEDVVLSSNDTIVYDRKEELQIISQSNSDFEQWENDFPKLPKTLVSYPHKHKLLKPEIRRTVVESFDTAQDKLRRNMPQWTWYAAAACLAIIVLVIYPTFESDGDDLLVQIDERYEVRGAGYEENEELKMKNEIGYEIIANDDRRDVLHTSRQSIATTPPSKIVAIANEGVCNTPQQEAEQIVEPNIPDHFAIATIAPIEAIALIETTSHLAPHTSQPDNEQILRRAQDDHIEIIQEISRRERVQLAVTDRISDPLKSTIHNIARRFYTRKNEVEMFVENVEMPKFFAQR